MNLTEKIKAKATEIGFDAVGITTAEPVDLLHQDYFCRWLSEGNAGGMDYLHRHIEKRFDPAELLPGARSVICTAVTYELKRPEPAALYGIASFALHEDYHPVIKEKLFALREFIESEQRGPIHFKVCVDSAPLAERAMAQRAGLGFIGRSRMLIHPELGSHLLLGELITTLELEPDQPMDIDGCRNCRRCIDACPAGALANDGGFDARRCISYMTIEHKGDIGPEFARRMKNYIFGCDECLRACPYNDHETRVSRSALTPHPEWLNLTGAQILDMTQPEFERIFANSGILRLGLERFKRNCRAALSQ